MADFHQPASLPTLHHLASAESNGRDEELAAMSREQPIALLLPALHSEMKAPALPNILRQVGELPYISEVVLSMNGMDAAQAGEAAVICRQWLGQKPLTLLWNDGPALRALHDEVAPAPNQGKGANIWMGLAWLLARGHQGIIVSHDTDILNYGPSLLAKLCYPLAQPEMGYAFSKGYYSRVADRLYGRVTRLLIFPLTLALQDVLGSSPMLEHFQSFRYPLSGEFAAQASSLGDWSMPSGWGLEIAMLAEAKRHLPIERMCQVDLGFHYEHRHRPLQESGLELGLVDAAAEVARTLLFQVLDPASSDPALGHALLQAYGKRASSWIERYAHVAKLNGLRDCRREEKSAVEAFTQALRVLLEQGAPTPPSLRPPASSVINQRPEWSQRLLQAAL